MPRRMKNRVTFLIERLLVRGAHFRLLVIAALIGLVSIAGGLLVLAAGAGFTGPGEAIWWAFLRLTDPGYLGDDEGVVLRTVSTVLTITGYVLFLGALIAIMTQWLNQTLRTLERGLTPIAQRDHILILGWTNRTATIASELLLAEGRVRRFLLSRGVRRLRLVVLAEEVDSALVQEMRERLGPLWDERALVFRSGTPLRTEHLQRVDFLNAAVIVIPGGDFTSGGVGMADTRAIKVLLSITNHPAARAPGAELPLVVTEIFDARKLPVARGAYGGAVEILASDAMISRLIAQNVRHSGLSRVYGELLTHGQDNEIYVRECPEFVGSRLQDLGECFPDAVLLGVVRRHGASFRPLLNPPAGFVVEADDRLVLLARSYEDSAPVRDSPPRRLPRGAASPPPAVEEPRERRVLLLGWSHKVPALIREFDSYPRERFHIDVLSTVSVEERIARVQRYDLQPERVHVQHHEGDYTVPSDLARIRPDAYDNILLLGSDWLESGEESDARTILGYLLLREALPETGPRPDLLLELLDPGSVSLFRRRHGEVLISPLILSHMLAQVALRRELRAVFDELFGPGGAEISFRSAADYHLVGREVSFRDIRGAVALQGETALGVRLAEADDRRAAGVLLNPSPDQRWALGPGDDLVVLATSV